MLNISCFQLLTREDSITETSWEVLNMLEADLGAGWLKLINVTLKFDNKKKTCLQKTDNNFTASCPLWCSGLSVRAMYCKASCSSVCLSYRVKAVLLPARFSSWIMWSLSKAKGCLCVSGPFEIKRLGILPAGIHDCCRAGCDREWEKQMEVAVRWSLCRFTLHFTVHQTQFECTHTCMCTDTTGR